MKDNKWVIYDGNLIKANQPVVPVESRGLMYGDGCFETFRVYKGSYFKPEAHLNRLRKGSEFLGLDYPSDLEISPLKKMIAQLLHQNNLFSEDAVIRIQLWREGERGYSIQGIADSHYSVLAASSPVLSSSVTLATVDTRRIPNEALPSQFKLCNNINYITAARQARQKGSDDALMQTIGGFLSETTIANVFWIVGNTFFTPSTECDLLPGITRNILIRLIGKKNDIKIEEGAFRLKDIMDAEAVFICNSIRELVAVSKIDDCLYDVQNPRLDELKTVFKTYLKRELVG